MHKMTKREAQRIAYLTGAPCQGLNPGATEADINREANGQYGHGFEAVCKCGRTKGAHLAVRPWPQDDTSDGFPQCLGFKKA